MGGAQSKLLATLGGFKFLETLKVSESSTENKKGFTLAEDATHVAMQDNSRKVAFTLAEVLITLGIIGVVSAITMPMLITNVRNHVRAKRIENIEQKFSKATDKMVALGVMTGHNSTQEFVNELGKHLKLAKVCNNDNLQACWPYEKVIVRKSGLEWNIANTKNATDLKLKDDITFEWDKTMGIITADGTSMILSYNKKCDIDETKPINYGGSISSTTGCVAVVYDWNGATKPNKYGDDVLSINSKGLGLSCGSFEIDSTCYTFLGPTIPEPMSVEECAALKDTLGISCTGFSDDRWAGAVKACGKKSNLPSFTELAKFQNELYSNGQYNENSEIAKVLNLKPPFAIWTGTNDGCGGAYYGTFNSSGYHLKNWCGAHGDRSEQAYFICKDEF